MAARRPRRRLSRPIHTRPRAEQLEERRLLALAPLGSEFLVNTAADIGTQITDRGVRAVAEAPDGRFVVAYQGRGPGDPYGVFTQLFDRDGVAVGPLVRANVRTSGAQEAPSVDMAADGSYVVTWSGVGLGDADGVFARRFDASGQPLTSEFVVGQSRLGRQESSAIATRPDGTFVLAWEGRGIGDTSGVFVRLFAADGTPLGGELRASQSSSGEQEEIDIAALPDGGFVAVWSGRGVGDQRGVFLRRFDSTGHALGGELRVNSATTGDQTHPSIAANRAGEVVVAWSGRGPGDDEGVFWQRFDSAGARVGANTRANTVIGRVQESPSVALSAGGHVLVTWSSYREDGSGWGVYGREFDATGHAVGGQLRINSTITRDQENVSVAWKDNGPAVVAWSGRGVGDNRGVFARRFAAPGQDLELPVLSAGLASDTGDSPADGWTRDATVVGIATDNSGIVSLTATIDGGAPFMVPVAAGGAFSLDGSGLVDGPHLVVLSATDPTGNSATAEVSFRLDTVSSTPSVSLATTSDTGAFGNDGVTSVASPVVRGTADLNDRVRVRVDGDEVTVAVSDGNWFAVLGPLSDGGHHVIAIAEDGAGNISQASVESSITVDTQLPTIHVDSPVADAHVVAGPAVSGAVADGTQVVSLRARLDQGEWFDISLGIGGGFSFPVDLPTDGTADGTHFVTIEATDLAGNVSHQGSFFTLDTPAPTFAPQFGTANDRGLIALDLLFSEAMGDTAFQAGNYSLVALSGAVTGPLSIDTVGAITPSLVRLNLPLLLPDGDYQLTLDGTIADLAGNGLAAPRSFAFSVGRSLELTISSPAAGEEMVSPDREIVVHFSKPVDPLTVTTDALRVTAAGQSVTGSIDVSPTGLFAVYFPDESLPASTQIRVRVDGELIRGLDGTRLDADRDQVPGGVAEFDYRTLPLQPVPGTGLFGYVYDSYNRNSDGSERPVVGATLRLDGLPGIFAVTDASGYFELRDTPAPEFFVHIDGSTATTAPAGTLYPSLGKKFHTTPGRFEQLNMAGTPFNIYLPPMDLGDLQDLSPTETTPVGFGAASQAQLVSLFPDIDPAAWGLMHVDFPAGSAVDRSGVAAPQAIVIPVAPDRIPAPLPPYVEPRLVISIQAPGATNFRVPPTLTFPNIDGHLPGDKVPLLQFNHAAGRWDAVGNGTVSADGTVIVSDPGSGPVAPGWFTPLGAPPAYDCNPLRSASETVVPLPVLETDGETSNEHDAFWAEDGGALKITVANKANRLDEELDPKHPFNQAASPMIVVATVEGPLNEFASGLSSGKSEAILLPGQEHSLTIQALPFNPRLKDLSSDRLYLARVTFKYYYDDPGLGRIEIGQTILHIARFVAVVNPVNTRSAAFLRTLVDGSGGYVQEKRVDLFLPKDLELHTRVFGILGDENAFHVTPTLNGDDSHVTWRFDPTAAGVYAATLILEIDPTATPPRTLLFEDDLTGRGISLYAFASDPSQVVLGRASLLQGLQDYLGDKRHFNGTLGVTQASDDFKMEFAGMYATDTNAPNLNGDPRLAAVADAALSELQRIFLPLTGLEGTMGSVIVKNELPGGESLVTWSSAETSAGRYAETLRDDVTLQLSEISDASRPVVAKLLAIGNGENRESKPSPTDMYLIGLARGFKKSASGSFGAWIGSVLGHEMGHSLGLNDAYVSFFGFVRDVEPFDVMSTERMLGDLLDARHVDLLRVMTGIPDFDPNRPRYAAAVELFRQNFNNPEGQLSVSNDARQLRVRLANEQKSNGGTLLLGTTLADGVGGDALTTVLAVANVGSLPLMLNQVSLDGAGYSLDSSVSPGLVLNSGESLNLIVRFDPQVVGAADATLTIQSDSQVDADYSLTLSARGVTTSGELMLTLQQDQFGTGLQQNNFGGNRLGDGAKYVSQFATITNTGGGPLTVSEISVDRLGLEQFGVAGLPAGFGPENPLVLAPGESFTFDAWFDAANLGLQRGAIRIVSDDPVTPELVRRVIGTGLPDQGSSYVVGRDFAAVTIPDNPTFRTITEAAGQLRLFMPQNVSYELSYFDPQSGLVAHVPGISVPTIDQYGQLHIDLGVPSFFASETPDQDGDGLPDDAEYAIGSNPLLADSDGDGVDDFAEITRGLSPVAAELYPIGQIASAPLRGNGRELVIVADGAELDRQTAYVASDFGIAILDATDLDNPVVLGELGVPGGASDIAVDESLRLAVTASAAGYRIFDVSDPGALRLVVSAPLAAGAQGVETLDGLAYVASGDSLLTVDLGTGELVDSTALPAGVVVDMARDLDKLYLYHSVAPDSAGAGGTLLVVDLAIATRPTVVGQYTFDVDQTVPLRPDMVAANGLVYLAHALGTTVLDVTDPAHPQRLHDSFADADDIALNGSGLALYQRGNELRLYDVSNPLGNPSSLGVIASDQHQAVEIAAGLAFAVGATGFEVYNYLPFDAGSTPPLASISTFAVDVDPLLDGLQVVSGTPVPIRALVFDDVQVSRVELLLNNQVVAVDLTFPHEFQAPALPFPGTNTAYYQIRAFDTGGHVGLSDFLAIEVVPDTQPPVVTRLFPAPETSAIAPTRLLLEFNEPVDVSMLAPGAVLLVEAGPDHTLGSSDDVPVEVTRIGLRPSGKLLEFDVAAPLVAGVYRLALPDGTIFDGGGLALDGEYLGTLPTGDGLAGGQLQFEFTVVDRPSLSGEFPLATYPTTTRLPGATSNGATFADVDGDGRLDAVAVTDRALNASTTRHEVFVSLATGDGFASPIGSTLADLPFGETFSLDVGDLDGDAIPDLVVWLETPPGDATNASRLQLFVSFGLGNGAFGPATIVDTGRLSLNAGPLRVVDIDGDGANDVVLNVPDFELLDGGTPVESVDEQLLVLLGDGLGGLAAPLATLLSGGLYSVNLLPRSLPIADVNGDAVLDIVAPYDVLLGNGDGTFALSPHPNPAAAVQELADLNGDGLLDLVSRSDDSGVMQAALGVGDGTFVESAQLEGIGAVLALIDLNGDSRPEVVSDSDLPGLLSVELNQGDGTFLPPQVFSVPHRGAVGIVAADLHGDSVVDLLVLDPFGVTVVGGVGDGTVVTPELVVGAQDIRLLADLNLDGRVDGVGAHVDLGSLSLQLVAYANTGGGLAGPVVTTLFGPLDPTVPTRQLDLVGLEDLDGDGVADLVYVSFVPNGDPLQSRPLYVATGNTDLTFNAPVLLPFTARDDRWLGDVDGDGVADLVMAGERPEGPTGAALEVRLGQGDGTFGTPLLLAHAEAHGTIEGAMLGVDSTLDLVLSSTGRTAVFLGQGSGPFSFGSVVGAGDSRLEGIGDLTGDGIADLVVGVADTLSLFVGQPDGGFLPLVIQPLDAPLRVLRVADINNDQRVDLILANDLDEVLLLLSNGDGTFQPARRHLLGNGGDELHLLDVDDGLLDLLVGDSIARQR